MKKDTTLSVKKVKTVTYEVKLVRIKLKDLSQIITMYLINVLNGYDITTISIFNMVDEITIRFEANRAVFKCISTEISNKNLDAIVTITEVKKKTTKSTKDKVK